ncbi:hypothetical protein DBO86_20310 [Pseudomonas indoloxydans]|uniref:Uncharacterized protein n=2 Tax=Ectopseudomonas TaxID=3236654 RepID=A0A2T5PHX7_ECTOL|nr:MULTISPECIES: hypothetical protein [Pseudomonas]PTU77327.1 hypothetical protein DBO86_20310 [Pseudomonas indoloxydans]TRO07552.1 hypothetical protein EQ829_25370 [Pseudomonas mendocina]TRO10701.1 hypothetical protein EQ836_25380 [Pseudomonas mendocina]
MNNASHLLAQHGELLQVGPVITGQPLGDKSPRFLSAVCVAALCIAFAAGAGHITQGVREEAARVAAAEKAEAARLAEEKRIAAAQVAGLQKRLTAMQTQISTERDALQQRFQRLLADKDKDPVVAEMVRRYPTPHRPLQGIDPTAFDAFIDLDRQSWISSGTSPKLDEHYQVERAKVQAGADYLRYINEALELIDQGKRLPAWMGYERFASGSETETRELKDHGAPAKPEARRSVPAASAVPMAPEPVMPLEIPASTAPAAAPAPAPAAAAPKPRTAPTGVPGKVQVLDW